MKRSFAGKYWGAASLIGLVLLIHLALAAGIYWSPRIHNELAPSAIFPESGKAYQAAITSGSFYTLRTDDLTTAASRLVVLEDGRPLGPAHSLHDDIRQKGGGRFSHWGDVIYLSSSDGSDPRA